MASENDRFQNSENYWQKEASHFSRIYNTANPLLYFARAFLEERQRIIELMLPKNQKGLALDVGCGSGEFTSTLSKHFSRVVGTDYSEIMLNSARERFANASVSFVHADCARLPFEAGSAQFLSALGLLDYVADVNLALKEFRRVLQNGGEGIFTIPKNPSLFAPLRWSQKVRHLLFKIPPIINIYTKAAATEILSNAGFDILESRPLWTTMWIFKVKAR